MKGRHPATVEGMIEAASELSERFPDMTNLDICEFVEFVCQRELTPTLERVVIAAYDFGPTKAWELYHAFYGHK